MYVCVCVCMYSTETSRTAQTAASAEEIQKSVNEVCMYVCIYIRMTVEEIKKNANEVCIYMYMYVCMYVCVYDHCNGCTNPKERK